MTLDYVNIAPVVHNSLVSDGKSYIVLHFSYSFPSCNYALLICGHLQIEGLYGTTVCVFLSIAHLVDHTCCTFFHCIRLSFRKVSHSTLYGKHPLWKWIFYCIFSHFLLHILFGFLVCLHPSSWKDQHRYLFLICSNICTPFS